jgi:hypothetical protein
MEQGPNKRRWQKKVNMRKEINKIKFPKIVDLADDGIIPDGPKSDNRLIEVDKSNIGPKTEVGIKKIFL